MELRFTVAAGDDTEDEIRSLFRCIRNEEIDGSSVHLITAAPGPADLGGITDSIAVALGSGGTDAALASIIREWLRQRRNDVDLTIKKPDGSTTHLKATGTSPPDRLLEKLEGFLKDEPR
jgi:hypothetical protein